MGFRFLFFKDINSAFSTKLKFDYAIVCNWGPDHLKTTKILIEKGINKITIEKPFCNDIEEGKLVDNLLKEKKIRCNVHYRWPYLNLKSVRLFSKSSLKFSSNIFPLIFNKLLITKF